MTSTEKFEGEKFEADLRVAMAPVPASADLKREILLLPLEYPRHARSQDAFPGEIAAARLPRYAPWYAAALTPMNFAGFAAAASLALGIFAGSSGYLSLPQAGDEIDLAGLAYDPSTSLGDL